MAANPEVSIPASAHCKYGPKRWTMLHPRPGRLELSFPFISKKTSGAGWWILSVVFAVGFALYAWVTYWIVLAELSEFSWDKAGFFVLISAVFWGSFLGVHPRGRMVIQKLVIDKSTGMITATGLVFGRSVLVEVPIAAVTEVEYWPGSRAGTPNPAEIDIHFVQPHRTMRFPRLAPGEENLRDWICAMLGQPHERR
jgi:hypothetical protein